MKSRLLFSLLLGSTLLLSSAEFADAKEWTINERQDQLMKDINEAQKKNDLTDKEAKKLRGRLADVARKEVKMRGKKSSGSLSDADKATLEGDLNNVSVDIKKYALEKRVNVAKDKANAEAEAKKKAEKAANAQKKAAEKKTK